MGISSVLKNRIGSPVSVLVNDCKNKKGSIGFYRMISSSLKGTSFATKANRKLSTKIISTLENDYADILDKYAHMENKTEYDPNAPIWVCWLQGMDNAPQIVKQCVKSIKKSTKHPVIILDKDNIANYCKFPEYIYEKHESKHIENAQFSDILRMTLLAQYGGFWIDATVFIPNCFPEELFKYEFYTCKRKNQNSSFVSGYRWTSFFNGCQKGSIVQTAMMELFFAYWKKENYLIDYLLLDYFMLILYNNCQNIKKLIDDVPYNNSNIEQLQNIFNDVYNESDFNELLNGDTYLFKTSWRMNFVEKTADGKETYFGHFINQNMD